MLICMFTDGSDGGSLVGGVLVVLGCITSIMSASVIGLASILPQEYIKAANIGLGLSGFLPPAMKLGLLVYYPRNRVESVEAFLILSSIISLLCIISVLVIGTQFLERNEFAQYYFSSSSSPASPAHSPKIVERLVPRALTSRLKRESSLLASPRGYSLEKVIRSTKRSIQEREAAESPALYLEMDENVSVPRPQVKQEIIGAEASIRQVLSCMWVPCVLLFVVTYQTFLQIPGLIYQHNYHFGTRAWGYMTAVTTFRFSIFAGVFFTSFGMANNKGHLFFIATRVAVMWITRISIQTCPDVTICVGEECFSHETVFGKDWFRLVLLVYMGLLQGYSGSALMAQARNRVSNARMRDSELEMCGHLMSCSFTLGMTVAFAHCHAVYFEYIPTFYCGT